MRCCSKLIHDGCDTSKLKELALKEIVLPQAPLDSSPPRATTGSSFACLTEVVLFLFLPCATAELVSSPTAVTVPPVASTDRSGTGPTLLLLLLLELCFVATWSWPRYWHSWAAVAPPAGGLELESVEVVLPHCTAGGRRSDGGWAVDCSALNLPGSTVSPIAMLTRNSPSVVLFCAGVLAVPPVAVVVLALPPVVEGGVVGLCEVSG